MAHETLVHCADARVAAGEEVDIRAEFAADAIDEWLTVMSRLNAGEQDLASVLPAGRSLHVHATDPGLGQAGEWLLRHSAGDGVQVLSEHGSGDAALTGPAATAAATGLPRPAAAGAGRETQAAGLRVRCGTGRADAT